MPSMPTRFIVALACSGALLGCATAPADSPVLAARYADAIASPIRTEQDRRMDAERKPAEFLPFAHVMPGMRVLDVSAGGGYTSQLLALAVGPQGTLYAQTPRPSDTLRKRLAEHPQANFVLVERPFDDPVPDGTPPLDLVTLILNYHDISYLPVDRKAMNAKLFAALKPGGHFVVIDHSSRAGKGISEGRTLHRIDEAVVVDEVRRAGFVLEAEGDFLRNPDDPRDTPSGAPKVPTDKFALRFVKPR
ncbi:MAG TPA: methyltransferase [Casimicrobiaceae bacterium]|nr:methyltransferase [Casimicrobiaceae bacterium]